MNRLGKALEDVPVPDSAQARERAVREVSAVATGAEPTGRTRGTRLRTVGVAACAGLALAGFSFTDPGRAITGDLGRLVGIGDEPTSQRVGEEAVVIGAGGFEEPLPFEIVAQTNQGGTDMEETCIFVDFPGASPSMGAGNCLTGDRSIPLETYARRPIVYSAPPELGTEVELIVQGMIPVGATVSIDYTTVDGKTGVAQVHLADLTDELGTTIGVADRAAYFVAALPRGVLTGSAEDPTVLAPESVAESLSRVHYVVESGDGTVITDQTLDRSQFPVDLGADLLMRPPQGFSAEDLSLGIDTPLPEPPPAETAPGDPSRTG